MGLLIFCGLFFYTTKKDENRLQRLRSDYPTLQKENELIGSVLYKFDFINHGFRDSGRASCINVKGENYTIFADEINSDRTINQIISVGDSIIKHPNSDTIILIQEQQVLYLLRRD